MKDNIQTLPVDPCRCGALSHHFQGVGSSGKPKLEPQRHLGNNGCPGQASRAEGRRVPGEPHLGAAGRARGQPDPLSSSSRWLTPGLFEAGATHRRPATWPRTKPNRRARADGGLGQGTRSPLGSPCPRADGEVSKTLLSPGGWRSEDAAEAGLEAPWAAG